MRSECENKCSIFEEHRRWKPNLCREGPPKVLRDKNGKRYHPLNPFKYVIQIKKDRASLSWRGWERMMSQKAEGEKVSRKTKKSRCKDTKARKSSVLFKKL